MEKRTRVTSPRLNRHHKHTAAAEAATTDSWRHE